MLEIVYDKGYALALFGNQNPLPVTIIVNFSRIRQRQIQVTHIPKSRLKPAVNNLVGNVVPALADATRQRAIEYSGDGSQK